MSVLNSMKIYVARHCRRVPTNWPAQCLLPPDDCWVECRVVDLSLGGAALEIAIPTVEPQGLLTLALHDKDGHPLGLELRANVSWWDKGSAADHLRIGVEFLAMTRLQQYALAGLTSEQRRRTEPQPARPGHIADGLATPDSP